MKLTKQECHHLRIIYSKLMELGECKDSDYMKELRRIVNKGNQGDKIEKGMNESKLPKYQDPPPPPPPKGRNIKEGGRGMFDLITKDLNAKANLLNAYARLLEYDMLAIKLRGLINNAINELIKPK